MRSPFSIFLPALFLIACADDMAVAIPLAMTAAIGRAAKRGVIVKGGDWFTTLARMKTLVLDKTGTLTYGTLKVSRTMLEPDVQEKKFWEYVGITEKFSEHPIEILPIRLIQAFYLRLQALNYKPYSISPSLCNR